MKQAQIHFGVLGGEDEDEAEEGNLVVPVAYVEKQMDVFRNDRAVMGGEGGDDHDGDDEVDEYLL